MTTLTPSGGSSSIKKQVEDSRRDIFMRSENAVKSRDRWARIHIVMTVGAVALAGYLGLAGKQAAETIGGIISGDADAADAIVAGWRSSCVLVALLAGVAHYASSIRIQQESMLARLVQLHACLKNLLIDEQYRGASEDRIAEGFQRLNELYPEFVN